MSKKHDRMRGSSHRVQSDALHPTPSQARSGLRISPSALGAWEDDLQPVNMPMAEIRKRFAPAYTLGAPEEVRIACDEQLEQCGVYSLLQHSFAMGQMPQTQFLGYGTLQQISQNGMIRACVETTADDMTRNWIELKREGEAQKSEHGQYLESMGLADEEAETQAADKLSDLQAYMQKLKLQKVFHEAVELVGYMGGCLIFIDTGETDPQRLREPLNISSASLELKSDRPLRFVVLDPINVFPGLYNSLNPLQQDYFKPKTWWVLGQEVHASRLIRLVANEVPVLLKPAYNFFGIAQAQVLWDYVMHFQNVRIASQRLLGKFSLTVMKTDMANVLTQAGGTEELDRRISLLVRNRSNDGVQVIDKEMEDILKLETPLSGVTDIVRQSLEILAAMNRTPAVKLLGISPSGFNATGESDLRNYYDHVLSQQEKILRPALTRVLNLIQIKQYGEVDSTITFDFAALSEADEAAIANTQKLRADTMSVLLQNGIVAPEECRRVLADDPDSGFADIDVDEVPESPESGMLGQGTESSDVEQGGEVASPFSQDAALDAEKWKTSDQGKHFQVETTTGEVVKGNVGQKSGSAIEKQEAIRAKIDSIQLDPHKDNLLPNLNQDTLQEWQLPDKPILIKKNVIERNAEMHPDVPFTESKRLIGEALYNPVHILRGNAEKDYLNFVGIDKEKHGVVLVDVQDTKTNFEVVHWHRLDLRGVRKLQKKSEKIEQQASKEGQA